MLSGKMEKESLPQGVCSPVVETFLGGSMIKVGTPKTMNLEVEDELLAQDPLFKQHKH